MQLAERTHASLFIGCSEVVSAPSLILNRADGRAIAYLPPRGEDREKAEYAWCYPLRFGSMRRSVFDSLVASEYAVAVP